MTRLIPVPFIFLLPFNVWAQSCDCISQYTFAKSHFEKNNPAFQEIRSDAKAFRKYTAEVRALNKKVKKETSSERCLVWLEEYVALLKDHHCGIDINLKRLPLDFSSPAVIDSFKKTSAYQSFNKNRIDSTQLRSRLQAVSSSDIEGVYTDGGSITFALLKAKKNHYTAFVLKENRLLNVGHVLLELEATKDPHIFKSIYNVGLLGFNFQKLYKTIEVKNGKIPFYGFYRPERQREEEHPTYSFMELDTQTNYLQLSSFDYSLKDELNAFYKKIDSAITAKPYLIIDLRNNGGGSEECYFSLLPYVYTAPFKIDDAVLWVSPDNIRQYEKYQNRDSALIRRMKSAREYSFIPLVENPASEWRMHGTANPRKVAVLFNQHTASSAESMITYCIQSGKVITMGANSGGYLGYGNVMTTNTPCGMFTLRSTTTKYKNNSRYEFTGIEPMIKLPAGRDWIEAARKNLQ